MVESFSVSPAMSDASTLNEEFSLQLRGSVYLTTVSVAADESLSIIIEKDDSGEQWKGEFSSRYVGNRPHPARSEQPWTAIFWGCCSSIQCCKSYRSSRYIFRLRQAVAARATFGIRLLEAVERIWRLFVIATQVKARCLYQGHPSHTVHE